MILSSAALAQRVEVGAAYGVYHMSRTPLGSISTVTPKETDTRMTSGNGVGARVTFNTRGYYGHELGYFVSEPTIETIIHSDTAADKMYRDKIRAQALSYNFLMYMMPAGERWRPYLTAGLQATQFNKPNIPDWTGGFSRKVGFNFGMGLKIKLVEHLLVRIDLRDHMFGKPFKKDLTSVSGGHLTQLEASAGFSVGF